MFLDKDSQEKRGYRADVVNTIADIVALSNPRTLYLLMAHSWPGHRSPDITALLRAGVHPSQIHVFNRDRDMCALLRKQFPAIHVVSGDFYRRASRVLAARGNVRAVIWADTTNGLKGKTLAAGLTRLMSHTRRGDVFSVNCIPRNRGERKYNEVDTIDALCRIVLFWYEHGLQDAARLYDALPYCYKHSCFAMASFAFTAR